MERKEQKTTIFLSRRLYQRLRQLSKVTKKSMGELLRDAAERQYCSASAEDKASIVRKMGAMHLPIGTPEELEEEILRGRLMD